jgi:catechol 2,3-dioxygenase-like lactoylglutathione lyase family enzyme
MRLNQLTVPTLNLTDSIEFYQKLGLELIVHAPPRYARFLNPDDQGTYSVHLVEQLPQGEGISLYFECEHLEQEVAKLEAAGLSFYLAPTLQPWLWQEARLKDPDGNQLILFKAGEYRINPP